MSDKNDEDTRVVSVKAKRGRKSNPTPKEMKTVTFSLPAEEHDLWMRKLTCNGFVPLSRAVRAVVHQAIESGLDPFKLR